MSHVKLGEYDTLEEAYAEIDKVSKSGKHPMVECRQGFDECKQFSVWSGPADPHTREHQRDALEVLNASDPAVEALSRRIAERVLAHIADDLTKILKAGLGK